MVLSGKSIFKVSRRMRRGAKPVNIEVTEPVRVEALDLDAQGITRLAPNEEEQALGQSGKVIFIKGHCQRSWSLTPSPVRRLALARRRYARS